MFAMSPSCLLRTELVGWVGKPRIHGVVVVLGVGVGCGGIREGGGPVAER